MVSHRKRPSNASLHEAAKLRLLSLSENLLDLARAAETLAAPVEGESGFDIARVLVAGLEEREDVKQAWMMLTSPAIVAVIAVAARQAAKDISAAAGHCHLEEVDGFVRVAVGYSAWMCSLASAVQSIPSFGVSGPGPGPFSVSGPDAEGDPDPPE